MNQCPHERSIKHALIELAFTAAAAIIIAAIIIAFYLGHTP
jgi:hypothetical protein